MNRYLENVSLNWTEDSIRLINTPTQLARSSFFYMQEAGYFKTMPPYFTERANLSSFLILYTISGQGILEYQGKEYTVSAGQCFFIHCQNHHRYYALEGPYWEFLWLHFYGSSSLGYYQEFERNGFRIMEIQEKAAFEAGLRQIIAVNQEKTAASELFTSHLIIGLLTRLLMLNLTGQASLPDIPVYVQGCLKYIDTHFPEEITLDRLSSHQHVSKYYLSREFKRCMGITLQEYLINTRITHAKELLKYTDMTVGAVAYACGIPNVSHFINLFKAKESMTPLSYRHHWKD